MSTATTTYAKQIHGIDIAAPGGIVKLLDFHRLTFGDAVMEAGSGDGATPGTPGEPNEQPGEQAQQGQSFTQADVDRIVRERLAQQAKNKFGDYDDLKTKAGESQTLEQRVAEMESRATKAEQDSLRSRVAAEFGVSTKKGPKGEPSDADLFLTGADESTLTAQAQRLAGREEDRKKQGNFAPKEGTTQNSGGSDEDMREFARGLFKRPN